MIKDIVVNLGLGASDPAGDYAVSIAEAFGAHLLGIAVSYEPVIPSTVMGGVPPEVIDGARAESNKRARAAITRFEQAAKRAGISMEARVLHTSVSGAADQIARIGRRFDLIVVGQPKRKNSLPDEVVDEGVLVEIVRPGTGDPVAPGEVGEVVVTTLFNADYPLIRFGTGDLSAALAGTSSCGRTNMRIKGWLGRADQRTKVKGMFVDPAQIAAIVRRHGEIVRARLVIDNPEQVDRMTLHVEVERHRSSHADAIVESIREVTKLRGEVEFHAPGELANDGKVIDDRRRYD